MGLLSQEPYRIVCDDVNACSPKRGGGSRSRGQFHATARDYSASADADQDSDWSNRCVGMVTIAGSGPTSGYSDLMAGKSGAAREFGTVAERVAPRLYRIGLRMCGNPADAEELVQETLLQGFRKWHQFEGRSDPATWLYTIAGRLCQRRRRLRAGEPKAIASLSSIEPSSDDPVLVLAAGDSPLDAHLRLEAERAVSRALDGMPESVRLPVVLADIAELSTAEIARILHLKEATVKTRVHRGRLMLRRRLLEQLPVRTAPPSSHDRQVCLDLLRAKQEAMDRHVPFSVSAGELCERCQSLFATLDLARDACATLGGGDLPPRVAELIRRERRAAATPRTSR